MDQRRTPVLVGPALRLGRRLPARLTGYQVMDWMSEKKRLSLQLGDSRRVICSLTYSDTDAAMNRLATAFEDLVAERFNEAVVTYLRAGRAAGMVIPDASDPELATFRVVRDAAH
ncbi:hypothetical protein AB0J83_12475 [Actinoplanes sp. NPDC049596]|uniref:hypothetical protein n=1 Tax=unclassified Actinoplanes TaxID=2626549 RepID=UPI003427A717